MDTTTIARQDIVAIATALCARYGMTFTDGQWEAGQPTITGGDHVGSSADWVICWEDAPDEDWHQEAAYEVTREVSGGRLWAEAVNHWSVAFYV